MALTNKHLILERPHPAGLGGTQRIYRFSSGYGLSAIDMQMAHSYSFAWEIAVLKNVSPDGESFNLCYDTELTNDVEVFDNDHDANTFIEKAEKLFGGVPYSGFGSG